MNKKEDKRGEKRRKSKQAETDEIRESKTVMGSDEVEKGMEKEIKEKQCSLSWENILELRVQVCEEKQRQLGKSREKLNFKLQKIFDERN